MEIWSPWPYHGFVCIVKVIVSARKPDFFQKSNPLYEIVTEEGLMRPCFKATSGTYGSGSCEHTKQDYCMFCYIRRSQNNLQSALNLTTHLSLFESHDTLSNAKVSRCCSLRILSSFFSFLICLGRYIIHAFSGGLYCGGSALMVEKALGFHGDETLYVGDHIYTDVSMSKVHLRWRTALICRELEKEVLPVCLGIKVVCLGLLLMHY